MQRDGQLTMTAIATADNILRLKVVHQQAPILCVDGADLRERVVDVIYYMTVRRQVDFNMSIPLYLMSQRSLV